MIHRAKAAYQAAVDEAQCALSCVPPDYDWYARAYAYAEELHAVAEHTLRACGVTAPKRFHWSLVWATGIEPDWLKSQYGVTLPGIAYA